MRHFTRRGVLAAGAATVFTPTILRAQDKFPSRPITFVVPFPAGGTTDLLARIFAQKLAEGFGQPVVVENTGGGGGSIGADKVAKATPDGYTLLIVPTTFTVNAALNQKLPFDPERDFEPIGILVKNPLLFSINAELPAKTLPEFVALAKAQPGKFNYGSSGASTQAHLLIEMWSELAGIKMQHIPYKGGAPAALAVASNEVQFVMLSPLGILNFVEAGKVRSLATGSLQRDPTLPNLPTASESGFPGFEAVQWLGLLATRGTPREVVTKINTAVNNALKDPELTAKLAAQGTAAAGSTPDEFKTLIATEIRNWKQTAAKAGIKAGN
jgi:tripartite-type tricarboxylate transporter receptor subunit TctC